MNITNEDNMNAKEIIIKIQNFKYCDFEKEFIRVETTKPYNINTEFPKKVKAKLFIDKKEAIEYILNFLPEIKYDIDFDHKEIKNEKNINLRKLIKEAIDKLHTADGFKANPKLDSDLGEQIVADILRNIHINKSKMI